MTIRDVFVHTAETAPRACRGCRAQLDGATGISDEPNPILTEGAITCCAYCATILVVTADGFRLATDADLADLDDDLRAILLTVAASIAKPPRA